MACDLFWTRPFPSPPLSETLEGAATGREGPAKALLFAWQGICVISRQLPGH